MSITVVENAERSEGPKQITEDNVIYWSRHYKMLKGDVAKKAHNLLIHDCVKYVGHDVTSGKNCFLVLPLNLERFWHEMVNGEDTVFEKKPFSYDYNKSTYKVYKNGEGVWECNCQSWQTKKIKGELNEEGVSCSHVGALFLAFKVGRFGSARSPNEVI